MKLTEQTSDYLIPPQTLKRFASVRGRVRSAVKTLPQSVTLLAAREQIRRFEVAQSTKR
jgi:hypothetical protein